VRRPARQELLSGTGGVPVGPCPTCEREVLAYLADGHDALGDGHDPSPAYACVHCGGALRVVHLRDEGDLAGLGYAVTDPLAAGCGTGCAAGGCASKPRAPGIDDLLARYRRLA